MSMWHMPPSIWEPKKIKELKKKGGGGDAQPTGMNKFGRHIVVYWELVEKIRL